MSERKLVLKKLEIAQLKSGADDLESQADHWEMQSKILLQKFDGTQKQLEAMKLSFGKLSKMHAKAKQELSLYQNPPKAAPRIRSGLRDWFS